MKMVGKLSKGFTLIEILVTVVIIATGLFGLMVLYHNAARAVLEGDINLMATFLARERLEQIVSDKVNYGYAYVANPSYTTNEPVTVGNSIFTRSFNIYEVSDNDLVTPQVGSGYKRITMTVSWGMAANESITIPTLVSTY